MDRETIYDRVTKQIIIVSAVSAYGPELRL